MYKRILAFVLLFLFISSPVHASLQDQLEDYKQQLQEVEEKAENTTDRSLKVDLVQQENQLAKYVRAYEKAITYSEVDSSLSNNQQSTTYSDLISAPINTSGTENDLVEVGTKWIGNSKYVFGGGRNHLDVSQGRFDCSSFVWWAFAQNGIELGHMTSVTTDTLKHYGKSISINNIQVGDLVFFDTYKIDGHVGIYAGDGKFLGAQGSTGVAFADMTQGYWKEKFNGRVKRIINTSL